MTPSKETLCQFAREISERLKRRHFDEHFIEDLNQLERFGCSGGDALDAFLRTAMYLHMTTEGIGRTRHQIDAYFLEYLRSA